jgi:DNA-binding CsgD family transcriptional regulator
VIDPADLRELNPMMKVRGLTILTRKAIVTRQFGAEAWMGLYRDVAGAHRCFRSLISPETLVPLPDYLALHDELVRRFYTDEEPSNFALGRQSARWAMMEGPCKTFLDRRDLPGFVRSFPKLWKTYFADTDSRSRAALSGDSVEFEAFDLPQWHPYLEHFVMGYMTEVLEMFCANPISATRIRGGSGRAYQYLLHSANDDPPGAPAATPLPSREASRHLSNRETDVLLLVAAGKTNPEIGDLLGISAKTVQHHVARAYRKIGVTGRVGAAIWLAQRGLVGN